MQRLEVSGAVRPIYGSLDVKRLIEHPGLLKSVDELPVKYFLTFRALTAKRQERSVHRRSVTSHKTTFLY